ncbi:MAG: hypothetical protein LBN33_09080 [Desulfovibrio sp.]|jgi:hypothetical protein|nr:hypothetical protein [Desulfovibrio sp.]
MLKAIARYALPLLLLMLNACTFMQDTAPPDLTPPAGSEADRAAQAWEKFAARVTKAVALSGPFRIAGNMRYKGEDGKNNRVSILLWGNGKANSPRPLRLDLLAGIGIIAAQIREDSQNLVAFIPEEKTAYTHSGENRAASSFGVPLPLSIGDLALLLTGCQGELFLGKTGKMPRDYVATGQGFLFTLEKSGLEGRLELSESGLPLLWKEEGPGWSLDIEYENDKPARLRVAHPRGYSALVVVKEMERVSPPYSPEQLALILPEGTATKTLRLH